MSNVHEDLTKHAKKLNRIFRSFLELDTKCEKYISEAVSLAEKNHPFTVVEINRVTKEINELAKKGIAPTRKLVTEEMVKEYVNRSK